MKKFERDTKIARVLSAVGVGVTTYCFLRLVSPGLPDRARLVLAVLGYSWHRLGFLSGFDCPIDKLLDMGLVDVERYLRQKQAADQRIAEEKSQDIRGDGG